MRIDCEQCGAGYTIDDALVTERGVRAQCPKCGTQKVVRKPAASTAAAAPGANPFAAPTSPPAAAGNPFAPPASANPFAPPAAAANPFGAPPPPLGANPSGIPTGNPFGAPAPSANPFASGPATPSANPFAAPVPAPSTLPPMSPQAGASPFAAGAPGANPFAAPSMPPAPGANPFAAGSPFAPPASASSPSSPPSSSSMSAFGASPPPSVSGNPFAAGPALANPFAPPSAGAGAASNPFGASAAPSTSGNPFAAPTASGSANPFGAPPPQSSTGNPFGAPPPASGAGNPFAAAPGPAPGPSPGGVDPFASFGAATPSANADPFANAGNPFAGADATNADASDPFAAAAASLSKPPVPSPTGSPFGAPGSHESDAFGLNAPSASSSRANLFGDGAADLFGGAMSAPAGGGASPFARTPSPAASGAPSGSFGGRSAQIPGPPAALELGSNSAWRLRTAKGEEAIELPELQQRVRAGSVMPTDEAAPPGDDFKPIREHAALSAGMQRREERPRVAGARARGPIRIPFGAVVASVVVAAVVAFGAVYKLKPEIFEKRSEAGVNPLRRAKPVWIRQFPDVEGTAQEHVVAGRKQMRLDTAAGYRKADEEFRQALLLDIGSNDAIAGYVENFANLPTVRADLDGSTLANEAVDYALKRSPGNVDARRAQAALRLALNDVDGAQRLLVQLVKDNPSDVDALVLLARSHLERNPQESLTIIQRDVRSKDPDLKSAFVVEGGAQRRLGEFRKAREQLEARLASDGQNVGALKEIARLELDVGNAAAAVDALTRLVAAEDKDVEAHLQRARVQYQLVGGADALKKADGWLSEVLAKHENAAGDLLLAVLAHSSYVKTALGEVDQAIALGERARATDGGYPAALFVLGRAYAAKGDLDKARKVLEQAVVAAGQRDTFFEPTIRAELARMQAKAGDVANATRNYEQVIDFDPRNFRAHFGLAALYMKQAQQTQAMTIMRRALLTDPLYDVEHRVPTDFPGDVRDLIEFADAFRDAAVPADDESFGALKLASEGVIRFHIGDFAGARSLFEKALLEDRYNHGALLYAAVIALQENRPLDARKLLKTALDTTGASHSITRMYYARAQMLTGEEEEARKTLTELVEQEPTLTQARYSLGMALRRQKLEAQAGETFRAVVVADPDYLPAKQALAK